jgi:drug/metabolite transporter (DMT)-like permease
VSRPARQVVRGIGLASLAALLFGVTAPVLKVATSGVGAFTAAALLYFGAASAGLAFYSRRRLQVFGQVLRTGVLLRLLAVALFGAVFAPTFLIAGLARADGATASLILVLEAPFTIVLARLLFREHLDRRVVAAICLVAIGAAVLVVGTPAQGSSSTIGVVLVGAAALAWALDNIVSRTLADLDPDLIVALKGFFGASLSAVAALVTGEPLPGIGRMAAIVAVGTIGYGLSLRFYLRAQTVVGAARTASVFATAPFIGAFLGYLLGSAPSGWQLPVAGVLMFGGVALHALERHKHRHAHEPIEHEHLHAHDDGHHTHEHKPSVAGSHSHVHRHDPVTHEHEHSDDIHHRHGH